MIPEGWKLAALRDLGNGQRPAIKAGPFGSSLKKSSYVGTGFRVYGQEQVIAGDFSRGNYFIDSEKFATLRSCEVIPGDLLMSLVGTFGKVAIVPDDAAPGIINPRLLRLSPDTTRVWPAFLKAYLESPIIQKTLGRNAQGGTMGVLNATTIGPVEVALPPLPEQRKLATILTSVDGAIEATQAVIEQLGVVKKAMMAELLTGGIPGRHMNVRASPFGDIPESWNTVPLGEMTTPCRVPVEVSPFLAYHEIGVRSHGKGVFHKEPTTGQEIGKKRVFSVRSGCLVVNIVFAWEGAVAATSDEEQGKIASHRFPMFRPIEGVADLNYLRLLLQSRRGVELLGSISPGGAGRNKTLNQDAFRKLPIPVPPLTEQKVISSAIVSVECSIVRERLWLAGLLRAKSALMSVLLTGEVRVQPDGDAA